MSDYESYDFQQLNENSKDAGLSPILWGGAISLLTLLFLAAMLFI